MMGAVALARTVSLWLGVTPQQLTEAPPQTCVMIFSEPAHHSQWEHAQEAGGPGCGA